MTADEARLAARQDELLRRSAQLRSSITEDAIAISSRLRIVDKATAFLRSGGGRAVVWGGILLMLVTGPSRVFKLAGRSTFIWSLVRRSLPWIMAFRRGRHRD